MLIFTLKIDNTRLYWMIIRLTEKKMDDSTKTELEAAAFPGAELQDLDEI